MLPLILERNNLFNRGSQGGCSRRLSARSSWASWSDGSPLIHHLHNSSPNVGKGLILLGLHSCVHSLIELRCHPYKRKILVKKNLKKIKEEEERSSIDELNTYSFFPQSLCFVGKKQRALDQGSEKLESASQPNCQNLRSSLCTQWLLQRIACTCS